jgi:hypothetical protein
MKKIIWLLCFWLISNPGNVQAQGKAYNWLLGYSTGLFDTNVTSTKSFLRFDSVSVAVIPANFSIPFRASQGNISDEQGHLLFVSNGCYIADSTGSVMLNGGGLNPGPYANTWCDASSAIPNPQSNVILPFPGDTSLYYLFHQTMFGNGNFKCPGLNFTVIDRQLNNGLGGVVAGQKNLWAYSTPMCPGIAVTRHANGRDWWIIGFSLNADSLLTFLFDPGGITLHQVQVFPTAPVVFDPGQILFDPMGEKLAFSYYGGTWGNVLFDYRLYDFDRCSGSFSNLQTLSFTDSLIGLGLSFSPNSRYLYSATFTRIRQFDLQAANVLASMDTVAVYDGYAFPYPFLQTMFWTMYLAANGKIYLSSGNSVIDFGYINYPDSAGMACDVRQHALRLPNYAIRSHVFHPNYYLGCDTTLGCPCLVTTGLTENGGHDFKAKLSPNPGREGFEVLYLLPQNKSGVLTIFDLQGREMQRQQLPPWSTLQSVSAAHWSPGVYMVRIESDGQVGTWKWVKF